MHEIKQRAPASQLPLIAVTSSLLAITLVGLLVRLHGLTDYGLWFDEAYHVELVKLPTVWSMLDAVLSNPPSDPLYVLILRPWTGLFGTEAAAVRSLSVVFSTATIPATFFLGRYMLGHAAGLGGALVFALSPYAIELGQEAALYSLAALLTTLLLAAGWRWVKTGRGLGNYVVLGIFAIYSHYVVAVILTLFAALVLLIEIRDRETRRRWVFANGIIMVAWLPWLIALIMHWLATDLPRVSLQHRATPEEVVGGLIQFTSGTAPLQQGLRWLEISGLALGLGLLLLSWWQTPGPVRRTITWIVGLFGVIYFAPALLSFVTDMWLFVPHFMLFLLPTLFVCMCGFLGTVKMGSPLATGRIGAVALVTWLVIQSWGIVAYNRYPPHGADGLRELAIVINAEHLPGQPVLVTPPALVPMLAQYYDGDLTGLPENFDLRRVYIPFDASDWYDRSRDMIRVSTEGKAFFWLVYRPELDQGGQLLNYLQATYQQQTEHHYDFSDLYLFRVRP